MEIKESIEYKLDKINLRLKESIPNQIIFGFIAIMVFFVVIASSFLIGLFAILFLIFIVLTMKLSEKKKFIKLFNKYYKVNIVKKKK